MLTLYRRNIKQRFSILWVKIYYDIIDDFYVFLFSIIFMRPIYCWNRCLIFRRYLYISFLINYNFFISEYEVLLILTCAWVFSGIGRNFFKIWNLLHRDFLKKTNLTLSDGLINCFKRVIKNLFTTFKQCIYTIYIIQRLIYVLFLYCALRCVVLI